jgi:N-ethylmaleimide reductase
VRGVVESFRHSANVALEAGFDGVEVHGANGYLIDQFLQSGSNLRTDDYGGDLPRRARFLLEVVGAAKGVWGDGRVGVRLSPGSGTNGIHDANPAETFTYAARRLDELGGLAYLHAVEAPVASAGPDERAVCATELLRPHFGGTLISTGGYTPETAEHALEKGHADLIGFGRLFIANPDLPARIAAGAPLNDPDVGTFYSPGPRGYVDYPALEMADSAR